MDKPEMTLAQRIQIEKDIGAKIVDDGLALGYLVSVFDCMEWTVNKSTDRKVIIDALMTTDEDTIMFYAQDGKKVGWVFLVYGNTGWDVICDHTVNGAMEDLLAGANAMADKFNELYPNG